MESQQNILTRREISKALGLKYTTQFDRVLPELKRFGAFRPFQCGWRMTREDFDRYMNYLKFEKE